MQLNSILHVDSQIEEIKNKLNVVDLVGSYVKLTKTGANHRGVCPFHSEKKPSFFVSPARQMWKCFGCGKGGDIFEFVKLIEGVEFGDALKMLAQKAGVELKRENPKLRTERQRLYEICELAGCFFEKHLQSSQSGKLAKEYLLKRGINEESLKKWRLGYSPDTWQGLSDFLVGRGYTRQEIVSAGLAVEKTGRGAESAYDRFRGRIIFPIFDLNSQIIGFGGRVFENPQNKKGNDEIAKYINTPQTLLYNKSNVLYGMNQAKLSARKKNQCVITEGYTDVIMSHQAGFENTVAASGTALTDQHLNILKRYSENLILAFDMDIAGDSATKRGINLAQSQGFNIKIIESYSLPAGGQGKAKDPADIILQNPQEWQKYIDSARSIMDYYFDSAFSAFDKNAPEGKKEIGRVILPAIKRILNRIEQSHWIQKLVQRLNVSEESIIQELKNVKIDTSRGLEYKNNINADSIKNKNLAPACRYQLLEEKLLALAVKDPDNLDLLEESLYYLFSETTKEFLKRLKNFINDKKSAVNASPVPVFAGEKTNGPDIESNLQNNFKTGFADFISGSLEDNAVFADFAASIAMRAEVEFQEDGRQELMLCLSELKDIYKRKILGKISSDIKEAEEKKDNEKVNILMQEFSKLTKEL